MDTGRLGVAIAGASGSSDDRDDDLLQRSTGT
jgi:hypothetical protein